MKLTRAPSLLYNTFVANASNKPFTFLENARRRKSRSLNPKFLLGKKGRAEKHGEAA
jgi:hypothetical protein